MRPEASLWAHGEPPSCSGLCSGVQRSGLGLQLVHEGRWGGVVRQGKTVVSTSWHAADHAQLGLAPAEIGEADVEEEEPAPSNQHGARTRAGRMQRGSAGAAFEGPLRCT